MSLHKTSLAVLFLLFTQLSYSQSPFGLILENERYDTVPMASEVPLSRGTSKSLRLWAPSPSDQGATPSCAGHAIAHALSICFVVDAPEPTTNPHEVQQQRLSASFIYNQIKVGPGRGDGASLLNGFRLAKAIGDCYERDFPNNTSPEVKPSTEHFRSAADFRIQSFGKLDNGNIDTMVFQNRIKGQLEDASPVVIGLDVPLNWKLTAATYWDQEDLAGHAMVIIGFNDLKGEFELMNSFGPDWADNGFISLRYELVMKHLHYAYVATLR
ncbi:MAG: C1 family peptidase [Saprospiraceae bacterium]